jgi:hypothetical protein
MSRYHLVTTWRVRATLEEVAAILAEPERLPEWWPSVYLDAREVAAGDEDGVGKEVELWTKGWLPYTLRWAVPRDGGGPGGPGGAGAPRATSRAGRVELRAGRRPWRWCATTGRWRPAKPAAAGAGRCSAGFGRTTWAMRRGEESLRWRSRAGGPRRGAGAGCPPPPGRRG